MPSTPAASVVVPTHQGAHRLPVLLDALAAQDVEQPWEAVVVVDGSTDDTRAVLDRYRDRLPLRVLDSPPPHGVVAALNAGYAAARGRVLIRCDDDLTPAADMVRRHLAHHAGRDDLGVIGLTRDVLPDTPYARVYGRVANAGLIERALARPADERWMHWAAHNSLTRATWDRAGGFDPRFLYGQDFELGLRLRDAGVALVVDPDLELAHRGPSVVAATRAPRAYVSGASRRLTEAVHGDDLFPSAPPGGLKGRCWRALVAAVAGTVRRREGYARFGALVDRTLPRLSHDAGRRAVALLVEAAGRAGRRHGDLDLGTYQEQKASELAHETAHRR